MNRVIDRAKLDNAASVVSQISGNADEWSSRFALLSDVNRLRLLLAIHASPGICVSDLAEATGMSDTAVSQALRLLRAHRWVVAARDGRLVTYELNDQTVHSLLHMLGGGHGDNG